MCRSALGVQAVCKCGVLGEVIVCTQGVIMNACFEIRSITLGSATVYTQVSVKESVGVLWRGSLLSVKSRLCVDLKRRCNKLDGFLKERVNLGSLRLQWFSQYWPPEIKRQKRTSTKCEQTKFMMPMWGLFLYCVAEISTEVSMLSG